LGESSPCRVVAVLGMHRSGTSWLAGSLQDLGLELGAVNEEARYNPKGNRENEVLQALHSAVIRDSGGAWDAPPDRVEWSKAHREQLAAFIADMCRRFALWGFKDPRTLLVLDEWHRQLPQLERVGIFRHPGAVAASLAARSPVPTRLGVRLWQAYNERLVAEHRRGAFPIMRFDGPTTHLPQALEAVARHLELPGQVAAGFFDPGLVRHDDAGARVPRSCRRTWDYLVEHAI
jgi:hypothetical protein